MPEVPTSVVTVVDQSDLVVSWQPSYNGGSPILAYQIVLQTSDGVTYAEDTTNCDGADATVISDKSCKVPIASLIAAPYSLPYGSSVYAKVKAINVVGSSEYSTVGNGAVIIEVPDAPINLSNNEVVSTMV